MSRARVAPLFDQPRVLYYSKPHTITVEKLINTVGQLPIPAPFRGWLKAEAHNDGPRE